MKKRFTEEQIVKIITRLRNGTKASELSREVGVTPTTLYVWKKKYKGMQVSEAKRLKELEIENSKMKRLIANQALDILVLKDALGKK